MAADPGSSMSAPLDSASAASQSPVEILQALLGAWRGVAEARLSLIGLDAARAAAGVARIVVLTVVAALIAILTWFFSVGLVILWAINHGFNGYAVTLTVIGIHLALIVWATIIIERKRRALGAYIIRHVWREPS